MPIFNRRILCVLLPALLLSTGGCSDGRPTRVPVSGRVMIDGKPLTYGLIRFFPEEGRASSGNIDSNGNFTLYCFEKDDGAIPGRHKVVVFANEPVDETTTRWHAPKKYINKATSGLEQVIDGPTDSMLIELTWNGGAPFDERAPAEESRK